MRRLVCWKRLYLGRARIDKGTEMPSISMLGRASWVDGRGSVVVWLLLLAEVEVEEMRSLVSECSHESSTTRSECEILCTRNSIDG